MADPASSLARRFFALLGAKACEWAGAGGLDTPMVDNVLSVLNLAACALYLYLALGPVYRTRGWARTMQTLALTLVVGLIVLALKGAAWLLTGSAALYSDAAETVVNVAAAVN